MSLDGAIAVNRFGLGGRSGEIDTASFTPRDWLIDQLQQPADQPRPLDDGGPFKSGGAHVQEVLQYRMERQASKRRAQGNKPDARQSDTAVKNVARAQQQEYLREMAARFALGFTTERPFAERLVWFWSNHFVVSNANGALPFLGAFEREAIRPNITGKFEDMVLASTRHPAMLLYLNNAQSIGPNSTAGKLSGRGLNENLGRELMELHTLGVDGGYTQADVIGLAKILTGWSLDKDGGATGFRYHAVRHEPGEILLRGKTYSGGEEAGIAAIRDLARDPTTARHIARKFAAHFIADNPPEDSVARLEKTFNRTGGDLKALAETIASDPNAWKARPSKMRSPVEYTTAAMRLLAWRPGIGDDRQVGAVMNAARMMGEFPFSAPSPKGWPDSAAAWSGPDALLNRIDWAKRLGDAIPEGFDALAAADSALGPLIQDRTRAAIKACSSAGQAIALLIASPDFQRR